MEEMSAYINRAKELEPNQASAAFHVLLALCRYDLLKDGVVTFDNFIKFLDSAMADSVDKVVAPFKRECPECKGSGHTWEVPGDIKVPCECKQVEERIWRQEEMVCTYSEDNCIYENCNHGNCQNPPTLSPGPCKYWKPKN